MKEETHTLSMISITDLLEKEKRNQRRSKFSQILLSDITKVFYLTAKAPNVHYTVFKVNIGAETLAIAPKMNPRANI